MLRGRAAVRDWMEDVWRTFGESHFDMPDVRDLGDRVLAIGKLRNRGSVSGAEVESEYAYLIEFEQGAVTRAWTYLDAEEALRVAGLLE